MIKFIGHIQQRQFECSEGMHREQVAINHFSIRSRKLGIIRSDEIVRL
jgi:hypothetical protein